MKRFLSHTQVLLFVALLTNSSLRAQHFTWVKGSTTINQKGEYGNMGVANATNNPGGRSEACTWRDVNGNFWLFGGLGRDYVANLDLLNDLWKYTPSTGQWVWVSGDNFIAQQGVYGTKGVSASANKPGCRRAAASWIDAAGNLWLFGGYGYDGSGGLGKLNDLWKFDPAVNQWTWISGSNLVNDGGSYGTKGVSSSGNLPPARVVATQWMDASGNFLLFGGDLVSGLANDLWKYSPSANEWVWIHGSNQLNQNGAYGTKGTASPSNMPGARFGSSSWNDKNTSIYLFGGSGLAAANTAINELNDMWKYTPATNEWTWIQGSNLTNLNGTYGTQGVSNSSYTPGSRRDPATWIDKTGSLWLFGGSGYPGSGSQTGTLNDLWKYNTTVNEWSWIKGGTLIDQNGAYGTINTPSVTNRPGGRVSSAAWLDGAENLWMFGGYGVATFSGQSGELNDMWKYTNCFISPISLTITAQDSSICKGESTMLSATGGTNYVWSHNLGTNPTIPVTPSVTTTYSVFSTDANSCTYFAKFTQTVNPCSGINEVENTFQSVIYPNPNDGKFVIKIAEHIQSVDLTLTNTLGQLVFTGSYNSEVPVFINLEGGVYYYKLTNGNLVSKGKVVIQ